MMSAQDRLESTDSGHRKAANPSALYICKAYADGFKFALETRRKSLSEELFPKRLRHPLIFANNRRNFIQ